MATRRIQDPGYLRHVISRGNGRMCIFKDDRDYREWIYQFGEMCEEFEVECWDYCVMPNHTHAALFPTKANISEAIRQLNSRYAQWWNRRHSHVGHVVQGRPKMPLVDSHGYQRELTRYIAMNPVRANLVDAPEKWRWSSYAATMGLVDTPPFLKTSVVLSHFGDTLETARARYAAFVLDQPDLELQDRIRSNERILGDAAFKKLFKEGPREAAAPKPLDAVGVVGDLEVT